MSDGLERLALGCLLPGFVGTTPPDWLLRLLADGLGGVVLFSRNVVDSNQLRDLTSRVRAGRPDVLVCIDEEGGDVTRLEAQHGSSYPGNWALGVVDDVELTRAVATSIGADLAGVGINLDLAPCADVNTNPANPIIGVRAFGADPMVVARHTSAYVDGLQAAGVAACAKHFPGHGAVDVDSHVGCPVTDWAGCALEPFQAAISANVKAVMTAHIVVRDRGDAPATVSPAIIGGVLRDELGFGGLVITDALEMAGVSEVVGFAESGVRGLAAGADALCVGGHRADRATVIEVVGAIVRAVRQGRLSRERVSEARDRIAHVAAWSTAAAPTRTAPDHTVGLAAARRGVRVRGAARLGAAPHVVELAGVPNVAVGQTPWGLLAPLSERDARTTGQRLAGGGDVAAILAAAAGRPLLVVGRDLHRLPWARAMVEALVAERPDAVVVEMGLPAWAPPVGGYVMTYGAARVNALAAVEVLLSE